MSVVLTEMEWKRIKRTRDLAIANLDSVIAMTNDLAIEDRIKQIQADLKAGVK